MVQEAMKRNFKTKTALLTSDLVVIKSYFAHKAIKSYFANFQPNSIRKSLKPSENTRWNYIARSKLHPENWTHLGTLRMLAKTYVNQVIWMKSNALLENTCSCCPKEINQCPCMFSICFKPNSYGLVMFWAVYFSGASTRAVQPEPKTFR